MSRIRETAAQILTANRLADGAVVYLSAGGAWTTDVRRASVARDGAAAGALTAQGQAAIDAAQVVGAYLIAVEETALGPRPVNLRERIRAEGPSAPVAGAVAAALALAYP